ncbi:MAG: DMT family transporter [Planctomycetia bacterium]|nr:DMT family transporter [Planctomycetia bacterium]
MMKKTDESASLMRKGTFFCIAADTMFGLSSFFLRGLTVHQVSADWTLMIKELIVALASIAVLCASRKEERIFPPFKILAAIFAIAFLGETVGLRSLITSYGLIGIVLANPVIRTFTILGSILLAAIFLHERPGKYRWISMIVLVFSLFLLAFGQLGVVRGPNSFSFEIGDRNRIFLIGFFWAALAGIGYALYSILMRGILRRKKTAVDTDIDGSKTDLKSENREGSVSIFLITAIVCGYGSLSGGIVLWTQKGFSGMIDVPDPAWTIVLLAGTASFFAIWLKSLAFRYATAGKVAVFSVLQLVLGAVLGMIFYQEPSDVLIWTAIGLTVFGISLSARTE